VAEARDDMIKGRYDLAQSQLLDILEVFHKAPVNNDGSISVADIIPFHPKC
jgi:hypothetical protein